MLKRTALYETHRQAGGRLIEFGGWEMPVQYTSIMDEHQAVRNAAGIFDISHMGEVRVFGAGAANFLNATLTNDIRKLNILEGQYTLMCNQSGGVVDDLYAYRLGAEEFLLVINASRIDQDVAWLEKALAASPYRSETQLENISDAQSAVAVQGPRVAEFIDSCFDSGKNAKPSTLKKNQATHANFQGKSILVARTGYTGEDGFEIIAPNELIEAIWARVMEVGKSVGTKPAGLGARDTLRTEVCYPLYGHELDEQTTPIEAGVGFFVALDKGDFTGRSVLASQKANGASKKLVAFKMTDKSAPPRPHYAIWSTGPDARKLGEVVSGTQSPTLGNGIGLGYVPPDFSKPGTNLEIEIRGKRSPAVVVQKPFYRKAG
jgi:aminomethyltransferase